MKILYEDVEPLKFVPEMEQLFPLHYDELCVTKEFPLEPNWEAYKFYAERRMLRVITVRSDGELVGYMVFVIAPHLHYKSCLTATEDIYYLRPDMRAGRIGIRMFMYAEEVLKRIGVRRIVMHTKVHSDNSRLFEYLGYRATDKVFSKIVEPK